jgi:hypothetical protein
MIPNAFPMGGGGGPPPPPAGRGDGRMDWRGLQKCKGMKKQTEVLG